MTMLVHPAEDQALRNRAFNCRMRNRHYEEVYYAFRALKPLMMQTDIKDRREWFSTIGEKINQCESSLATCLEYAQAAVFFGKSEKVALFSSDKRWGILQEELLLVYFLIELQSTMRYILSRLETDKMLQNIDKNIQSKANEAHVSGFISNLQKNLAALNLATEQEFRDLHTHIEDRFTIGNALFGTLQELQHFY
ncbi:MAG: hypothetical protein M0P13_04270 [Fibrobacteraceae bacterium]|nr:hypothetical protein [Fibrobacteraceae bacterium]